MSLLEKTPKKRLGYSNAFKEIKSHEWLKDFDFKGMQNRTLESPFAKYH